MRDAVPSSPIYFALLIFAVAHATVPPLGTLHVDTTRRTWQAAQDHCALNGGRLVSIYSASQNAAVRAAVDAAGVTEHVWLGGNDIASEGAWTWTEGVAISNGATPVNGAYTRWCAAHRP